jgi:hypothetical protein
LIATKADLLAMTDDLNVTIADRFAEIRRFCGGREAFEDVRQLCDESGLMKQKVAEVIGIEPWQLTQLLDWQKYGQQPRRWLTAEIIERIAAALNQSPDYVRALYPIAA